VTPAEIVEAVRTHDVDALSNARRILADPVISRCMYCGAVLHYELAEAGALRNADGTAAESHGACSACMATWETWMDEEEDMIGARALADTHGYHGLSMACEARRSMLRSLDERWRAKMTALRGRK
jgi:hypothetical protein